WGRGGGRFCSVGRDGEDAEGAGGLRRTALGALCLDVAAHRALQLLEFRVALFAGVFVDGHKFVSIRSLVFTTKGAHLARREYTAGLCGRTSASRHPKSPSPYPLPRVRGRGDQSHFTCARSVSDHSSSTFDFPARR